MFNPIQYICDSITREQFRVAYGTALEEAHHHGGLSDSTKQHLTKNVKKLARLIMRTKPTTDAARWRSAVESRNTMRAARLLVKDLESCKDTKTRSSKPDQEISNLTHNFNGQNGHWSADLQDTDEEHIAACIAASEARQDALDEELRESLAWTNHYRRLASVREKPQDKTLRKALEERLALGDRLREQRKERLENKSFVAEEFVPEAETPQYLEVVMMGICVLLVYVSLLYLTNGDCKGEFEMRVWLWAINTPMRQHR